MVRATGMGGLLLLHGLLRRLGRRRGRLGRLLDVSQTGYANPDALGFFGNAEFKPDKKEFPIVPTQFRADPALGGGGYLQDVGNFSIKLSTSSNSKYLLNLLLCVTSIISSANSWLKISMISLSAMRESNFERSFVSKKLIQRLVSIITLSFCFGISF